MRVICAGDVVGSLSTYMHVFGRSGAEENLHIECEPTAGLHLNSAPLF